MTVALDTDQQAALEALAQHEFPPTRYPHLYTPEELAAVHSELLSGDLRRDAKTLEAILLAYRIEVCHDKRSHRTYWRRAGDTLWTASTRPVHRGHPRTHRRRLPRRERRARSPTATTYVAAQPQRAAAPPGA